MKRSDYRRIKQNRIIAAATTYHGPNGEKERKERARIANDEAKRESIEERIGFAQRKCIQNIATCETELKNARKTKDEETLNEALENIKKAIDKAAADSIGRIIAEIKQPISTEKDTSKVELVEVNLPIDIFYNDFENFCNKELKNCEIDQDSYNKIVKKFLNLNLNSLKSYGDRFNHTAPAKKFEENLAYLEKVAVKENELSV